MHHDERREVTGNILGVFLRISECVRNILALPKSGENADKGPDKPQLEQSEWR